MLGSVFFSFVASLVICMALIPILAASATRLHFIDIPNDRKVHANPMAKIGGLAFASGTFVATLIWAPKDPIVVSGLIGAVIILIFGAWDDRRELPYRVKFFGQILAAITVIWFGDVRVDRLPLLPDLDISVALSTLLTVVLIVGVTNAINLADGLDGLAGGLALLSFAGMACLAYLSGDQVVLLMMVSILGGLLGFLRFNTYPARIFMGDAGSQFLGFYLAITTIVLTDPLRGPYTPALSCFLLGLPILDTLGVMLQRIKEQRSPFVADKNHLHHKFLKMGLSHRQAVLAIYGLQGIMVSLAYALRWQSDLLVFASYLLVAGAILMPFFLRLDRTVGGRTSSHSEADHETSFDQSKSMRLLSQAPIQCLAVAMPVFLVISVFLPSTVPYDIGSLACLSCIGIIGGMILLPRYVSLFVRGGLYLGSTFVMYLSQESEYTAHDALSVPLAILLVVFAFLVMLTIRFNADLRFHTTPLDYLMIFLALTVPILPDLHLGDLATSILIAKLLVLYFSFELLLHLYAHRVVQLGLVALWLLLGLTLRAWWT